MVNESLKGINDYFASNWENLVEKANGFTKNTLDAEDLVQEAYEKCAEHHESMEDYGAYISATMRNRFFNKQKHDNIVHMEATDFQAEDTDEEKLIDEPSLESLASPSALSASKQVSRERRNKILRHYSKRLKKLLPDEQRIEAFADQFKKSMHPFLKQSGDALWEPETHKEILKDYAERLHSFVQGDLVATELVPELVSCAEQSMRLTYNPRALNLWFYFTRVRLEKIDDDALANLKRLFPYEWLPEKPDDPAFTKTKRLDERALCIYVMAKYDDYSYEEIAFRLGISISTVSKTLREIRKALSK